ncbi:HNH endonuclease [bacterium]|nr:HNH endonuclease [bacterium]
MTEPVIYKKLKIYPCGKVERKFKTGWKEVKNVANFHGYNQIGVDGKKFYRHRLVVAAFNPDFDIDNLKHFVDHKDHNKLNNAFANLRVVTNQGNLLNRSNAKGYSWHKALGKWHAQITVDGKKKHLGLYDTEEEAHAAYLSAKEKYHVIVEIC